MPGKGRVRNTLWPILMHSLEGHKITVELRGGAYAHGKLTGLDRKQNISLESATLFGRFRDCLPMQLEQLWVPWARVIAVDLPDFDVMPLLRARLDGSQRKPLKKMTKKERLERNFNRKIQKVVLRTEELKEKEKKS